MLFCYVFLFFDLMFLVLVVLVVILVLVGGVVFCDHRSGGKPPLT